MDPGPSGASGPSTGVLPTVEEEDSGGGDCVRMWRKARGFPVWGRPTSGDPATLSHVLTFYKKRRMNSSQESHDQILIIVVFIISHLF